MLLERIILAMIAILSSGIAPGVALLCYFYLRDKYDVEPISVVFRTFMFGALLVFPIMFIQYAFTAEGILSANWGTAYILSGLLEEFFKWFILFNTVYKHTVFDEFYDGIVYGVAVSLGFATVENILYLLANGVEFALGRALLPVSSHALFGVVMGFYLGKGKFANKPTKSLWISLSLLLPIIFHGTYDFILLSITENWIYIIIPFMIFLWVNAMKKVKEANRLDQPKIYSINDQDRKNVSM